MLAQSYKKPKNPSPNPTPHSPLSIINKNQQKFCSELSSLLWKLWINPCFLSCVWYSFFPSKNAIFDTCFSLGMWCNKSLKSISESISHFSLFIFALLRCFCSAFAANFPLFLISFRCGFYCMRLVHSISTSIASNSPMLGCTLWRHGRTLSVAILLTRQWYSKLDRA